MTVEPSLASAPGPANREAKLARVEAAHLVLPDAYRQLIDDRALIDDHHAEHYRVEACPPPLIVPARPVRRPPLHAIRVHHTAISEATLAHRSGILQQHEPLRGFRAPILAEADSWNIQQVSPATATPAEREAERLVIRRLAGDGLLKTLIQVLEHLGTDGFTAPDRSSLDRLYRIGFPADLLAPFVAGEQEDAVNDSLEVLGALARKLSSGIDPQIVKQELETVSFRVPSYWQGFEIATESGQHEIGLVRMQLGGGYRNGIVPGDAIDVSRQMIAGLPDADFIVSVPAQFLEPVSWFANTVLPLRRRHQLMLVAEPLMTESWAQDNGKSGIIRPTGSALPVHATMAPRYASRDEALSTFLPTESFLMDGLQGAGHRVIQFPLLFQGGNLLAVEEPRTGRRILVLSEAVVHRNVALGLGPAQVLEILQQGFGVAECVVIPAASYHLDFDLNVRAIDGELVAFVNDPKTAALTVLGLGIDTFEHHGWIDAGAAVRLRYDLNGEGRLVHQQLSELTRAGLGSEGWYRTDFATMFRANGVDAADGNLKVFLLALDILESRLPDLPTAHPDAGRRVYIEALRRLDRARLAQLDFVKSLGWRVKAVPSMPDLSHGINYLNGIHHRAGYIMPAHGGFYGKLDLAAENAFRRALGENAGIQRIQCAELQRKYGAVHCAAAVFPAFDRPAGD